MLAQVSARLFDIQTFWVAPGSAQVEKKNSKSVSTGASLAHVLSFFVNT